MNNDTPPNYPFPGSTFISRSTLINGSSSCVKLTVGDRNYRIYVDTDSFDSCHELVFSLQMAIPELESIGWTLTHKTGFCMTSVKYPVFGVFTLITMVKLEEDDQGFTVFCPEWTENGELLLSSEELGLKPDQWPSPSLVCEYIMNKMGLLNFELRHDYFVEKYKMSPEDAGKLALMLGKSPEIDIAYSAPASKPNPTTITAIIEARS